MGLRGAGGGAAGRAGRAQEVEGRHKGAQDEAHPLRAGHRDGSRQGGAPSSRLSCWVCQVSKISPGPLSSSIYDESVCSLW